MSEEKGSKKRYIAVASAVAVVLIAVLAVVLVFGGREETYRSIRIVELAGGVTIDREGVGSLDASENMNLISGDQVHTAAGSYVVLRLDEDKYVMLGELGSMQVEADGNDASGRTVIHLEAGSVLNEIQNPLGEGASYEIVTPNATMSVRGTVFETRRNTGDANIEVLVYEGTVAVGLDGLEPALYGAGEYTQFTEGDSPQFLVERDVITEERINSQMIQRLQQIDTNGRSLDLGEAQLDELIAQQEAAAAGMAEDNNLPVVEMPESTPAPENEYPVAVDPTSAPGSAVTGRPVITAPPTEAPESSEGSPAVTPAPGWNPSPMPTPGAGWWEGWQPSAPPTAEPTERPDKPDWGKAGEYQAWWDAENSAGNGTVSGGETVWNVIFYLPPIAESVKDENGILNARIGNDAPEIYTQQTLSDGSLVQKPQDPQGYVDSSLGQELSFEGWYTEDGVEWDFDSDEIESANVYLFPVWSDSEGGIYYPVIWRAPEITFYRCYCVKEGSAGYENPVFTGEKYQGYSWPEREQYMLFAWEKTNQNNALWGQATETVKGVTALRAVWVEKTRYECLVLYVIGTAENGNGDLVDICRTGAGSSLSGPTRAQSEGIVGESVAEIVDWKDADGKSYKEITPAGNGIYVFYAEWSDAASPSPETSEEPTV